MKIYDCCIYFDENLMLDMRFNILNEHVDKFVVVEATRDHSGNPKKLNFDINSFKKFKENSLIDNNFLIQEGFLKKKDHKKSIKLIDSIQFKKKLQFKNFKVTPGAKKRIEELGGSTS